MRFKRLDINLSHTGRQCVIQVSQPWFEFAVARVAALPRAVWSSELLLAAPGTILSSAASEVRWHRPQPPLDGSAIAANDDPRVQMGASASIKHPPAPSDTAGTRILPYLYTVFLWLFHLVGFKTAEVARQGPQLS